MAVFLIKQYLTSTHFLHLRMPILLPLPISEPGHCLENLTGSYSEDEDNPHHLKRLEIQTTIVYRI